MDPICLGNVSKDWSVDNMKITGFTGYVYDLVLIMDLLQLMILKIFISIWWKKMILYEYIKRNKENVSIYDYVYQAKNY